MYVYILTYQMIHFIIIIQPESRISRNGNLILVYSIYSYSILLFFLIDSSSNFLVIVIF